MKRINRIDLDPLTPKGSDHRLSKAFTPISDGAEINFPVHREAFFDCFRSFDRGKRPFKFIIRN